MGRPATRVSEQQIEAALALLEAMAKKPKTISVKELVAKVLPKIQAAQAAGYSLENIAEALTKAGIKISASTLKVYLKELSGHAAPVQVKQRLQSKRADPSTVSAPAQTEIDAK